MTASIRSFMRLWAIMCLTALPAAADVRLLMAEEEGCYWCDRWNEEIGGIYPKTQEGAAAPLMRFDIFEGPPAGITLASRALYTPTFILIEDGAELGRIEGYPGEDFFWGLLGQLLSKTSIESNPS